MLSGTVLDRLSSLNDLGVIMDEKMTRIYQETFVGVQRSLYSYTSLVCPKLEYASCVWNPLDDVRVYRVERVQRRFIRYASRVVWVGRTCMICHHMRTDAPFCILTPLQKGGRL
jgi:hypothetical protein